LDFFSIAQKHGPEKRISSLKNGMLPSALIDYFFRQQTTQTGKTRAAHKPSQGTFS
jgi:hypothetical protein